MDVFAPMKYRQTGAAVGKVVKAADADGTMAFGDETGGGNPQFVFGHVDTGYTVPANSRLVISVSNANIAYGDKVNVTLAFTGSSNGADMLAYYGRSKDGGLDIIIVNPTGSSITATLTRLAWLAIKQV